jgi:hypothetical protein
VLVLYPLFRKSIFQTVCSVNSLLFRFTAWLCVICYIARIHVVQSKFTRWQHRLLSWNFSARKANLLGNNARIRSLRLEIDELTRMGSQNNLDRFAKKLYKNTSPMKWKYFRHWRHAFTPNDFQVHQQSLDHSYCKRENSLTKLNNSEKAMILMVRLASSPTANAKAGWTCGQSQSTVIAGRSRWHQLEVATPNFGNTWTVPPCKGTSPAHTLRR